MPVTPSGATPVNSSRPDAQGSPTAAMANGSDAYEACTAASRASRSLPSSNVAAVQHTAVHSWKGRSSACAPKKAPAGTPGVGTVIFVSVMAPLGSAGGVRRRRSTVSSASAGCTSSGPPWRPQLGTAEYPTGNPEACMAVTHSSASSSVKKLA